MDHIDFNFFLKYLFNGTDYTFKNTKGVYLVGDRKLEEIRTAEVYSLQYRTVTKILEQIPSELKKGLEIIPLVEMNSLVISGSNPAVKELKEFLRQIDKIVPVVNIELIILDIRWVNVFASHMSSFSTSTISNSTHFNFYGNESVQGLDINNTGGNLNGYLYMAGNAHDWSKQDNDIFYSVVNPSLRDTTITCPVDTVTYLDTTASDPIAFMVTVDTFETLEPFIDSFININLVTTVICGDSDLHNKPSATTVKNRQVTMGSFVVAPNPSNGNINVLYGITDSYKYADVIITDIAGRILMRSGRLNGNTGIVHLQLPASVAAGVVVCSLIIDGEVQKSDQVYIAK